MSSTRGAAPAKQELCAVVSVKWGDNLLATRHVPEGEDAKVGAAVSTLVPLPCESLGVPAVTVAAVQDGVPIAFVPRGIIALRERPREWPVPIGGPTEVTLSAGEVVSYSIAGFVITIAAEEAARAPWAGAAPFKTSLSPLRYVAAAALAHALVMGLSAQAAHASSFEDPDPEHEELRRYLAGSEDRSKALEKILTDMGNADLGKDVNEHDGDGKDGGGTQAKGVEGSMGSAESRNKGQARFAVSGKSSDSRTVAATRDEALQDAREFGLIAVLDKSQAPFSSFGDAGGAADPFAATGAMWATEVGETYGAYGLGLTGVGEGGGGRGEGIGLGTIGTIGHTFGKRGHGTGGGGAPTMGMMGGSWGDSWGDRWGSIGLGTIGTIGHGFGSNRGDHSAYDLDAGRRPALKRAGDDGDPRLPADAIRRIVRQSSGRFRACYQSALLATPDLEGAVTTRFMIGKDGHVKSAQNLNASLPSKAVVECVTRVFGSLVFSELPDDRPVTVSYPLRFSPTKN